MAVFLGCARHRELVSRSWCCGPCGSAFVVAVEDNLWHAATDGCCGVPSHHAWFFVAAVGCGIDKLLVETPDGSKYEWCWSRANFSANAILAISSTFCRAGAAKSEVRLYTYISKPTDKFLMPVLCFNVISGGSHAANCLACPEFLTVPTGAGYVAEDIITATEVYHMLTFGHQEDVRRDACNVGDETGFAPIVQPNNETLDFFTQSLELGQNALPRYE